MEVTASPTVNNSGILRRFVFTINNWTQEEYDWLTNQSLWCPKWMIVAKEHQENGTPHLQGACVLGKQIRFSTLKTYVGFRRAHLEGMRGTPFDSYVYCTKEDRNPYLIGELPQPGKDVNLQTAIEKIKEGAKLKELLTDDGATLALVKFSRGLTLVRKLYQMPRDPKEPPIICWLWGKTGTGKTRCCFELGRLLSPNLEPDIWVSSGSLQWFDGYDGHSVVILDDFRSKHIANFAFLLRLLDRYPMDVQYKGGFVNWIPKFIFITCNESPKECFSTRNEHRPEDIAQLLRRLFKIYHVTEVDTHEELTNHIYCDIDEEIRMRKDLELRDQ